MAFLLNHKHVRTFNINNLSYFNKNELFCSRKRFETVINLKILSETASLVVHRFWLKATWLPIKIIFHLNYYSVILLRTVFN